MPRMKILNSIEQEAFELSPVLNSAERKRHFDFPVATYKSLPSCERPPLSCVFSSVVATLERPIDSTGSRLSDHAISAM